ncbi:hypothetical protein P9911_008270 [Klebsiella oxytoca]|uniref:hypothetical protein n=1 Tax=Klebsiella oxytoca TaxID=571 RepID=UPI00254A61CD|nr:hypothetical protein [Klebsiella oxytoca]MEC5505833.1 hypothetical protein [Klebsiella oxytoca]
MSDELMTQAQIAREFSVSRARVSQAVKGGKLIAAGQAESGKALYSRADAEQVFALSFLNNRVINKVGKAGKGNVKPPSELNKNVNPSATVNKKKETETDQVKAIADDVDQWLQTLLGDGFSKLNDAGKIARSRAVREARMAALADIEVRKAQGELIEREIIGNEARTIGAEITAIMHNWPARLSPELAVMDDQYQIKQFLIDEVNKLIDQLGKRLSEV